MSSVYPTMPAPNSKELLPFDPSSPHVRSFFGKWDIHSEEFERKLAAAERAADEARGAEAEVRYARVGTIYSTIVATHALRMAEVPPDVDVYDADWFVEDPRQSIIGKLKKGAGWLLPKLREEPLPRPTRPILMRGWRIYDSNPDLQKRAPEVRKTVKGSRTFSFSRTLILSAEPDQPGSLVVAYNRSREQDGERVEELRVTPRCSIVVNPSDTYSDQTSDLMDMFAPKGGRGLGNPWQFPGSDKWILYRDLNIEGSVQQAIASYLAERGLNRRRLYGDAASAVQEAGVFDTLKTAAGLMASQDKAPEDP